MDDGNRRTRVGEEVLDGIHLEMRVDHHYHCANLQSAEQGGDKLRSVGKRYDDPLLRLDTSTAQRATKAIRQRLNFSIREIPFIGQESRPVSLPFLNTGVEEVAGDIELFGGLKGHGLR